MTPQQKTTPLLKGQVFWFRPMLSVIEGFHCILVVFDYFRKLQCLLRVILIVFVVSSWNNWNTDIRTWQQELMYYWNNLIFYREMVWYRYYHCFCCCCCCCRCCCCCCCYGYVLIYCSFWICCSKQETVLCQWPSKLYNTKTKEWIRNENTSISSNQSIYIP